MKADVAAIIGLVWSAVAQAQSLQMPEPADRKIDFARDVRPILASKCFGCHGPDKQLVGLRLDRRQAALRGGDYGKVILIGRSAESKLIQRLLSSKDGLQMPPTGALELHEIAILRAWIDQGADFGVAEAQRALARTSAHPGMAALVDAIVYNRLPEIRRILTATPELVSATDARGATALMHAASRGSLQAMQIIVDAKAPVDAGNLRGGTALFWAIAEPDKVKLLLDRKAKAQVKSAEGRTPLHNAARLSSAVQVLPMLLAAGADPNARDLAGITPLYVAAAAGNAQAIVTLLEAGAKVDEPALTGATPLMQAAIANSPECVRLLIAKGASAKAVTRRNSSALAMASYWGDPGTVKLLIEKGAPVNLVDADGYTPLKFAAYSEFAGAEVVRLLLASGADPKTGAEETALHLARMKGENEVSALLSKLQ